MIKVTSRLVIFSDHPASSSGLARITRDLALRTYSHLNDNFQVATLGAGSPGSTTLPFPQYHWRENDYYIPSELPFITSDLDDPQSPLILLTIGDVQRFLPLADPQFCQDQGFAKWWKGMRAEGKARLWGYFPIDAHGVGDKLPPQLGHTLSHYDRVLVPSEWAKQIVERTIPGIEIAVIPHGIDPDIFHPYHKKESQSKIGEVMSPILQWPQQPTEVADDALWVGIVATNQPRKDWGLGVEVVAELAKSRPVFLWAHSDRLKRDQGWSLLELISDFNLLQSSMITIGNVPDQSMALCYSAMDITLGIGRGEGFGYPIAESVACGTPCFTHFYGAQIDYIPQKFITPIATMRTEGPLSLQRPVCIAAGWARQINLEEELTAALPDSLKWPSLWPRFEQWFKDGLA